MNGGGPGIVRSPGRVCKSVRCRNPSLPMPSTVVSSRSRGLAPVALVFDVLDPTPETPGEPALPPGPAPPVDVLEEFVAILLPVLLLLLDLLAAPLLPPWP